MRHLRDGRVANAALGALALLTACSSSTGGNGSTGTTGSGGAGGGSAIPVCKDPGPDRAKTKIAHVVVVVQENHSFDDYFGTWCTAAPGSNPTCTTGASCCEAAPTKDPSGAAPVVLDDVENAEYDPDHSQKCELAEMNGGKMDRYVTGAPGCSNPKNFAIAGDVVAPYHALASSYAVADRYFQPLAGQSSSNDMYLAVAKWVFLDNTVQPAAVGTQCNISLSTKTYPATPTIADLLKTAGKTVSWYAEGYGAMVAAGTGCPQKPLECVSTLDTYPCLFSPGDVPFLYYAQFAKDPDFMKDYTAFAQDLGNGTLPDVSFVKAIGYRSEHPGYGTTVSQGATFVQRLVNDVMGSCYKDDTLVLVTWDESGGFYDHVAPPPDSAVDHQPYGPRVPLLAIGRFAKKGAVSHVEMEHSSIVKFIEQNYLGATGQLGARDAVVNNIGSLLDPAETGVAIPEK